MTNGEQSGGLLGGEEWQIRQERARSREVVENADTVIRKLKWVIGVVTVVCFLNLLALMIAFGELHEIRTSQEAGQIRGYKNRAVACFQVSALVGADNLPGDCLEASLTRPLPGHNDPLFNPTEVPRTAATLTQQKTRDLLCGFFRTNPSTQAFLRDFEGRTGEPCEAAPRP